MLIISKFPKNIANGTKCLRGPRVWNPCCTHFSAHVEPVSSSISTYSC